MMIEKVKLFTHQLYQLHSFYTEQLGLPLAEERARSFTVRAGRSLLQFVEDLSSEPYYHFAFTIPGNRINEAEVWLKERHAVLYRFAGGTHQRYSESWHATSLYFPDPAGNIVEFIAHHSLPDADASNGSFKLEDIGDICEIGLPVQDVRSISAYLSNTYNMEIYKHSDAQFSALGHADGLFILSEINRIWLGSSVQKANVFPLEITIKNGTSREEPSLGGYPYYLKSI